MVTSLELGKEGEKLAKNYLQKQGYKILESNFYTPGGEIDLICEHKQIIVFVEVRTRKNKKVLPIETLNRKKIHSLYKAAKKYLTLNKLWDRECRFDFIGLTYENKGWQLEHIQNFLSWPAVCHSNSNWQPW